MCEADHSGSGFRRRGAKSKKRTRFLTVDRAIRDAAVTAAGYLATGFDCSDDYASPERLRQCKCRSEPSQG
jgi:hypothetical protein